MRIVFMGTPQFAVPTLDALIAAGHELVAVYCQPPRPAGRGKGLQASAVQQRAEAGGIMVRTPESLRNANAQQEFAALEADVAVVAAYGLILPKPILDAPRYGCFNVHASLLPRWRGAAPIHRAILAGDETTGVTIMGMEPGLDTGPIYATRATAIGRKNVMELTDELSGMGGALMVEVLEQIPGLEPKPQPEKGVTYASKVDKSETHLDFSAPAAEVERRIRAFAPTPGAYFETAGNRIKIVAVDVVERSGKPGSVIDDALTIACGDGAIAPRIVQRQGRGPMSPGDLLRGFPIPPGTRLE